VLWDVAAGGGGRFLGYGYEGHNRRVFGGQVASQALSAALFGLAAGAVAGSLHARFVRPGRSLESIDYTVAAVGEHHRQVVAAQGGRTMLTLDVRLRFDSSPLRVRAESPEPAAWMPGNDDEAAWYDPIAKLVPFELRFDGVPAPVLGRRGERAGGQRFWFRTRENLSDDHGEHACALTYISDLLLVSTTLAEHGLAHSMPGIQAASLDHTVWFHEPFRADEWLLYEQETLITAGGRGLCGGRMSTWDGRVVATVRQEVLIRRVPS
jgi:acyl-CoA thioesterase-2